MLPGLEALLETPLFDPDWYAAQAGCPADRPRAARHYLHHGWRRSFSPHPLFDLRHIRRQWRGAEQGDPLTAFLSDPDLRLLSTHPLFEDLHYLQSAPDAAQHPLGPVGHYLEVGAAAGVTPNSWYRPDLVAEPQGLADWLRHRAREWQERRACLAPTWTTTAPVGQNRPTAPGLGPETLVSVIVPAGHDPAATEATLRSVEKEATCDLQLILVGGDPRPEGSPHVTRVLGAGAAGLNRALAAARGHYVTWLSPGEAWTPRRLERLVGALEACTGRADGAHDVVQARGPGDQVLFAGGPLSPASLVGEERGYLNQLLLRRESAQRLAPLDENLGTAAELEFVYRAHADLDLRFVPVVGVHCDQPGPGADVDPRHPGHRPETPWVDVVRNRALVDWSALADSPRDEHTISVVIPTYRDWRMTQAAVSAVCASQPPRGMRVEVVVFDNGSGLSASTVLDSLPARFADVSVVHAPVNHGFALGNNLALPHTTGDIVIFLNNDTEVSPDWLTPLVGALEDPAVLGAQSLLIYPSGTVQSAGVAFPSAGGLPYAFLQGFPIEDAAGAAALGLRALTGAALALRFRDVVAARGFDPVFRNGMEDVDLCLRLGSGRNGHFRLVPESVVVHHESRSPGRFDRSLDNRRLYLDRWGESAPHDDEHLWKAVGFHVQDHAIRHRVSEDDRLCVHEPVLTRRVPLDIREQPPRLRWAIKNPATPGRYGDAWGDTHFAAGLADALRRQGQEVVVDRRGEFSRPSGRLDDVVLVLRGREAHRPQPGQVNLVWLISHPESFTPEEAAAYHHVLAASAPWSRQMSRRWGIPIRPLLQATDPARFNPDRALADTGHPLLFVGNSRHMLRPMVDRSVRLRLPLHVYGRYWESLIPEHFVRGDFIPNDRLGIAYRSARIVLNDHWEMMSVHGFISNRLFDAVAAGARVVSDHVDGLDDLFGRSVQVAATDEDLVRLASEPDLDAVFGDDGERRRVAERVHREHSFDTRAKHLVELAVPTWRATVDRSAASMPVPSFV